MSEEKPKGPSREFLPGISLFRLVHWFFSWRILRRCLFGLACLVTHIALFYAEENWRGKRAWEKYRREMEAKGEKFDLTDFYLPPVPDNQNFARTPFLAPLSDFNPLPLKPNQTIYRDQQTVYRVLGFASDGGKSGKRGVEDYPQSWLRPLQTDFHFWVKHFRGTNANNDGVEALTEVECAAEVIKAMERYQPTLSEIETSSRRPFSRFAHTAPAGYSIFPRHISLVFHIGKMFALRASAKLALNQTNQAFTDIMTVFRVANALSDEPTLNGRVCRRRTIQAGLQPVWEGLGQRKWSDAQLAELEEWLQKVDALAYYRAAMREERASEITEISGWRLHRFAGQSFFPPPSPGLRGFILDYMPDGWYYQNQLFLSRLYDDYAISLVDPETHRVFPDRLPDTSRLDQLIGPLAPGQPGELVHDFSKDAFRPFRFFSQFNFPGNSSFSIGFSFFQTRVDQFRIACALERFRLSHGEYPQTLEALVPGLIKILPDDVTTGGRLKYHRNENGTFSLYSVGWNMKDDLGKIASGDDMAFLTQGDWVWPAYPAK